MCLVTTCWGDSLDRFWRAAVERAASTGAAWCLLFNGTHLRLIEARRLYARRHAEFDIDMALDDMSALRALVMLMSARALAIGAGSGRSALDAIVAHSERHAAAVCRSLRSGVLDASTHVCSGADGRPPRAGASAAFEQALTIVYRMLFLLFAEARGTRAALASGLSRAATAWKRSATPRSGTTASRAVGCAPRDRPAGARRLPRRRSQVTAFNGRLFAPAARRSRNARTWTTRRRGGRVLALSTRRPADGGGRERIAYRDLGVEQLGGVYETPARLPAARRSDAAQPRCVARRDRSARQPGRSTRRSRSRNISSAARLRRWSRDAAPERILALRMLDPSMGSGAFLVAACRYLARGVRGGVVRTRAAAIRATSAPRERAPIRRVDRRAVSVRRGHESDGRAARPPVAVARDARGRPAAHFPRPPPRRRRQPAGRVAVRPRPRAGRARGVRRRSTLPLFHSRAVADVVRAVLPCASVSPADAQRHGGAGPRQGAGVLGARRAGRPARDGGRVWPTLVRLLVLGRPDRPPARRSVRCRTRSSTGPRAAAAWRGDDAARRRSRSRSRDASLSLGARISRSVLRRAGRRRPDAGFDAIVGNPPWDMVRGDARDPQRRSADREDAAALLRFTRDSGVYRASRTASQPLSALCRTRHGARQRRRPHRPRAARRDSLTDHGSAPLRRRLFSQCDVDGIVGFENSAAHLPNSPECPRSCSSRRGRAAHRANSRCRFGETRSARAEFGSLKTAASAVVHGAGHSRASRARQRSWHGDSGVPCGADLAIVERAATSFAPLGDRDGWAAHFGRELNATEDRRASSRGRRRIARVGRKADRAVQRVELAAARCADPRLQMHAGCSGSGACAPGWPIATCRARRNRVTLIAAMLPARTASTHTVFCLRSRLRPARSTCSVACSTASS